MPRQTRLILLVLWLATFSVTLPAHASGEACASLFERVRAIPAADTRAERAKAISTKLDSAPGKWRPERIEYEASLRAQVLDLARETAARIAGGERFVPTALLEKFWPENSTPTPKNRMLYLDEHEAEAYLARFRDGLLVDAEGRPIDTRDASLENGEPRAMYVIDAEGRLFISKYHEMHERHHSSFVRGGKIAAAGMIEIIDGRIAWIDNNSGHYEPGVLALVQALAVLERGRADLSRARIAVRTKRNFVSLDPDSQPSPEAADAVTADP